MADLKDFDAILNWKLLAGSHKFPGPEGGTCINEAAIVAAGFPYRKVDGPEDCPPCFCPVLSGFAIVVNDHLDDRARQELMPLVLRLAGSRDPEQWVMRARAEFIFRELHRELFEPLNVYMFRGLRGQRGYEHCSFMSRSVSMLPRHVEHFHREFTDALADAASRASAQPEECIQPLASALRKLEEFLRCAGPPAHYPPETAGATTSLMAMSETSYVELRLLTSGMVWPTAALALKRAFQIGTQAPAADTALVVERMESARKASSPAAAKRRRSKAAVYA